MQTEISLEEVGVVCFEEARGEESCFFFLDAPVGLRGGGVEVLVHHLAVGLESLALFPVERRGFVSVASSVCCIIPREKPFPKAS